MSAVIEGDHFVPAGDHGWGSDGAGCPTEQLADVEHLMRRLLTNDHRLDLRGNVLVVTGGGLTAGFSEGRAVGSFIDLAMLTEESEGLASTTEVVEPTEPGP